jgi:hypothetical protein
MTTVAKPKASKLQPSRLSDQLELLRDDVDLSSLNLALKGSESFHLLEAVTDGRIQRTIEGASTVTFTVADPDRALLKSGFVSASQDVAVRTGHTLAYRSSGLLGRNTDIELDGLWFRLTAVSKTGDSIDLTFEDREVALLRSYPHPGAAHHGFKSVPGNLLPSGRARFAEDLVGEVSEIDGGIRFFANDLQHTMDALAGTAHHKDKGLTADQTITVKHHAATKEQLDNLERVLIVGAGLKARRKVLVCAVMVITQESSALQSATNGVHVGLFQQDPAYWPAERTPEPDAFAFFNTAISADKQHPHLAFADLCEEVQASGQGSLYAQWHDEAENTVDAFLADDQSLPALAAAYQASAAAAGGAAEKNLLVRGQLSTVNGKKQYVREDNWTCLQRLAGEVGYRCFCVSGTVYFVSEPWLFRTKLAATISEASPEVDSIDGDFNQGKKVAQITVNCRASRWQAPPGTLIAVADAGPFSGRWLVNTIQRGVFKQDAVITAKKPRPILAEADAPEYATGKPSGAKMYKPKDKAAKSTGSAVAGTKSAVAPAGTVEMLDIIDTHGDQTPVRIILHSAESDGDPTGLPGFFSGQKLGYGVQATIGADGTIVRMARDTELTWGCGGANTGSLQIELMGFAHFTRFEWLGRTAQLDSVVALCAAWCRAWKIPVRVGTESGISTHAMQSKLHPASQGHWDPGPGFPLELVLARIKKAV